MYVAAGSIGHGGRFGVGPLDVVVRRLTGAVAVVAVGDLEDHEQDDQRNQEEREVAAGAHPTLPLRGLLHRLTAGVPVQALALTFGGLGHGGGVYRRGRQTQDQAYTPEVRGLFARSSGPGRRRIAGRGFARAEVRGHVRRRSGPDPCRRRAHRAHPARRRRRRGRGVGHGEDHRRSRAPRPRGLQRSRAPARWTCCSPRVSASRSRCCAWRSSISVKPRCRSPARRPGSSPTPRTGRPRSSRSAPTGYARRSTEATSPWSRDSRACRPSGPSPRWAGVAPTPPRSRSRPRSRPTSARSTPTSRASTPPIRASCPTPVDSSGSPTTRCSRCRPPAAGCSRCDRSSSRATTACPCTCGRVSRGNQARGCRKRSQEWKRRSSRGSPTTSRRRRSRSCACPTVPGSPPGCSVRSPTRT